MSAVQRVYNQLQDLLSLPLPSLRLAKVKAWHIHLCDDDLIMAGDAL